MLSRTRNLPEVRGIAIALPYPWSSATRKAMQGFRSLKPFIEKLGDYLDIILHPYRVSDAGAKIHTEEKKAEGPMAAPYYIEYYTNIPSVVHSDPQESPKDEIERQWKGEIERYIKMGGKKERFIDFISAAKTGFPDERDAQANDKVSLFRADFIQKATREDIVHVMELHENIRARLKQSRKRALAEGDTPTYQQCSDRIRRLERGKRQLQFVLKRKSAACAS
jgi:hypothetical protein